MNILLAAEESAGMQVLRRLAASDHNIVGVLTTPDGPASTRPSLWSLARKHEIPTWPAARIRDAGFAAEFSGTAVDLLLNVHSLHVIRRELLALPRFGSFNLHPGPLPRYAGLNTPGWAILRGERTHGVTLHLMEPGIDTGPIAFEDSFEIEDIDTALSLYLKCVQHGIPLVMRLVDTLETDPEAPVLTPQNPAGRQYFGREVPNEGWLDLNQPASQVSAFLRAFSYAPFPSPWGHPRVQVGDTVVGIVKAVTTDQSSTCAAGTIGYVEDGKSFVACTDRFLEVHRVETESGVRPAADVLRPGDRLI